MEGVEGQGVIMERRNRQHAACGGGVPHLLILDYPSFQNFKALLRKFERYYACGPRAPQLKFPDGNQL